ncbi:uncharacterized protein MKK02DRAFT_33115 [Dioszegia hungarica]|uniref:RRM domain-containing protein n=1 Tax=Dioszegia hungarica TaxID=4972 RepID=A0AA38HAC3_9TREE|nr:uncharacterized protein MKK02DRAFT_33115 [Dioszegia hungarica]KAI9635764.1 hypothetical protein MKK02DRAFT_33115 [Dioszegia hungarica]
MALGDFFADTTTGSWADDDFLPTAPAPKDPSIPKRGDPGYLDAMPDRGARGFGGAPQDRADVPIPTAPPYTVYVGNLTFETDESELLGFFGDLTPVTSRLVKTEGKSKGFGYVEFSSVEKLKQALDLSGSQLGGRTVRISVAEPPSSRKDFAPSAAEEASQWRRTGPLPARDAAPAPRRGTSFTSSPAEGGAERDWGAARGARFTPSPQVAPSSQFGGERREYGRESRENSMPGRSREEMGPSQADDASAWRSSKPLIDVRAADAGPGRSSEQSSPGLADTESTWSRGSKLRTPVTEAPVRSNTGSPVEREWRSSKPAVDSTQSSVDGATPSDSPKIPAAPLERRKLTLAPRSAASPTTDSPKVDSPTSRSSIFGGAQPIDTAAKETAAAEKLKKQAGERRAAEHKAREEEDRAVKAYAEEREKKIREALAGAGVVTTPPAAQQERGAGGDRGARGGFRVGRGGGGPGRQQSGDRQRPPHQAQAPSQAPPARQKEAKAAPVYDSDGFVVATGKGSAPPPAQSPTTAANAGQPRKEVKKGFSFSAAVAAGGFADGEEGEKSGKAEMNGEGNAVEEVTKGVEDVTV